MSVSVRMSGRFTVQYGEPPPTARYVGFRGLHGVEGGRMPPPGMPEVIVPLEVQALAMSKEIQLLSWELMRRFCPPMERKKWRAAHRYDKAMTNGKQNGYEGGIAHPDWVNSEDLGAPDLPNYDKMQRSFGGNFIQGVDLGDGRILVEPGVHAIDATKPLPSVEEIVEKGWYVLAVSIGKDDYSSIAHFPQTYIEAEGRQYPCAYPFIIDRPIHFARNEFTVWKDAVLPDPLRIYKPLPSALWKSAQEE